MGFIDSSLVLIEKQQLLQLRVSLQFPKGKHSLKHGINML